MDPAITATLQEIAAHTQNTAVSTNSTSEYLLTLPQNLSEINRSTLDITRVLEAPQKTTENHSIVLLQLLQTTQSLSRTIQELNQNQRESNTQLHQINGFIIQELQEINHNPQDVLNQVLQSNLAILEEIQSSNAELELLNHTSIENYEAAEVYRGLQIARNEDNSAREYRREVRDHDLWEAVMAGIRHVQGQLDRIADEQRRENERRENERRENEAASEHRRGHNGDEGVVERHRRFRTSGRNQVEEVVELAEQDEDLHQLAQQAGIDLDSQPPPPAQQNSENTLPPTPNPTQNPTSAPPPIQPCRASSTPIPTTGPPTPEELEFYYLSKWYHPLFKLIPSLRWYLQRRALQNTLEGRRYLAGLQKIQIEMGRRPITLKELHEIRTGQDRRNSLRKQGERRGKRDRMTRRVGAFFAFLIKYWFIFLILFVVANVLQDTYRVAQFQGHEWEMAPHRDAIARAKINLSKTGVKSIQEYLDELKQQRKEKEDMDRHMKIIGRGGSKGNAKNWLWRS